MKKEELNELRHRLNHGKDGYIAFHKFVFEKITEEEVIVSLNPTKDLLNPLGLLHGGALFGLADTAAGILCRAAGRPSVTLKGSLDYLQGVGLQKIYAKAKFLNETYRTSVLEVRIEDEEGHLYNHGVFNYYRYQEKKNNKKETTKN
ncbi:MAG: PaaI family thioesterase [Tissierellia bacterium]|nr:PaaI family thioesterase [Tissierellia bacterium]